MTTTVESRLPFPPRPAGLLLVLLALSACSEDKGGIVGVGDRFDPDLADPVAVWIQESWEGRDPLGQAAVELRWELPDAWDGEVFRVYSRAAGSGDYFLIATVTSCADRECVYTDVNVVPGASYDYFVTAVDERSEDELGESEARRVTVPSVVEPTMPTGVTAIALDNAVFLKWESAGAEKYRVFLEEIGEDSVFFEIGSTDGLGYLDTRAENGTLFGYRVAGVDGEGFVSRRSDRAAAIPRPDYHAELIYTLADSALASGFRFMASEGDNPIVSGTAAQAQWRLEASGGELRIVPLGATRVSNGIFSTDLSCGPGSEADCEYVATAPAASELGTTPVVVSSGNTYVFQITDSGVTHFGKIRVQGGGTDADGRALVVFDWAYQLVPGEPSLNVAPR